MNNATCGNRVLCLVMAVLFAVAGIFGDMPYGIAIPFIVVLMIVALDGTIDWTKLLEKASEFMAAIDLKGEE